MKHANCSCTLTIYEQKEKETYQQTQSGLAMLVYSQTGNV